MNLEDFARTVLVACFNYLMVLAVDCSGLTNMQRAVNTAGVDCELYARSEFSFSSN